MSLDMPHAWHAEVECERIFHDRRRRKVSSPEEFYRQQKKNPTPNTDHWLWLQPGHLNEASGELGPAQAGSEEWQAAAEHYLSDTAAGNIPFLLSQTHSVAFLLSGFLTAATCYVLVKTGD